ncbi:unnamed protein product [Boreogadus saida]
MGQSDPRANRYKQKGQQSGESHMSLLCQLEPPGSRPGLPRAPASSTEGPTVQTEGNIEPSSDETQLYRRLLFTAARPLCKQGPGLRGWSSKEGRLTAQTKAMLAVFGHNTNSTTDWGPYSPSDWGPTSTSDWGPTIPFDWGPTSTTD